MGKWAALLLLLLALAACTADNSRTVTLVADGQTRMLVTDALTGEPLFGKVMVEGIEHPVFTDPDVVAAIPGLDLMLEQAKTVVNRPRVPWYYAFSTALQEELHFALTQQKEPQQAMDDAYDRTLEVKQEYEAA